MAPFLRDADTVATSDNDRARQIPAARLRLTGPWLILLSAVLITLFVAFLVSFWPPLGGHFFMPYLLFTQGS
jgi:hypothetical protein